jgi:glycosyltransferase involved in cell wall biosynthesis
MQLPVFATFQGGVDQLSVFERPVRPLTMHACTGLIIAPETEVRRVLRRYHLPMAKVARIFNPLDVKAWRASDRDVVRATLGIPRDAGVVAWHGRVDITIKGLDVLLAAWKAVRGERPHRDLRLLLVGSGHEAAELHRMLEASPDGIHWIDEYVQDRKRIRGYLSAADVYAFASRREGFPVAPVEAMACGLPVVAAAAPGVPDIFNGGELSGGIVVPCGDATAMAAALGRVLDDPIERRLLGERARQRVEAAFSPEVVGTQLRNTLLGTGHIGT